MFIIYEIHLFTWLNNWEVLDDVLEIYQINWSISMDLIATPDDQIIGPDLEISNFGIKII